MRSAMACRVDGCRDLLVCVFPLFVLLILIELCRLMAPLDCLGCLSRKPGCSQSADAPSNHT